MHVRFDVDMDRRIQLATRVPADTSGSVTLRTTLPAWTETETRSADTRQGSAWLSAVCNEPRSNAAVGEPDCERELVFVCA